MLCGTVAAIVVAIFALCPLTVLTSISKCRGSLVIDSECIAHHGALLGLTRSSVWMRDQLKEIVYGKKSCVLVSVGLNANVVFELSVLD